MNQGKKMAFAEIDRNLKIIKMLNNYDHLDPFYKKMREDLEEEIHELVVKYDIDGYNDILNLGRVCLEEKD